MVLTCEVRCQISSFGEREKTKEEGERRKLEGKTKRKAQGNSSRGEDIKQEMRNPL